MNRNLVGSILGRSSIKIAHLFPIRWQTWPLQAILVSDWLISKKLSHLKPLSQMNRNLVGSILGRSSIKNDFLPNFDSFGQVVTEEKILLEINQSETRIACDGHVC
jgi:hypothetical protein